MIFVKKQATQILQEQMLMNFQNHTQKAYSVTKLAIKAIATALLHTLTSTEEITKLWDLYNAISIIELTTSKNDLSFKYAFCN